MLIETTDNHPFWVEGRGWVFADELKAGDKLQKADGSHLTIDQVEVVLLDEPVMVYNFTVADYHTYYVTDLGIWVHNTNCIFSPNFDAKLKKHAQDIYETSRDLGTPVKKGDKLGMKIFISSVIASGKRGNSKPFVWNTLKSVDAYVKGDAVVLVNRETNEIVTFLNKKGGRLSSYLKSQLNLIK